MAGNTRKRLSFTLSFTMANDFGTENGLQVEGAAVPLPARDVVSSDETTCESRMTKMENATLIVRLLVKIRSIPKPL